MAMRTLLCALCFSLILSASVRADDDWEKLKADLAAHHDEIQRMLEQNLVSEGPLGYLVDTIKLSQEERLTVQSENVTREKVFAYIAAKVGKTKEEVGSHYASMVLNKGSS
jgi:uncharacterized protein YdbL (DUF1318 family)